MSIFSESKTFVLGELVAKTIPFLLLPYLTRSLGAEGYGLLSYYQVFVILLAIPIGLSQQAALLKYYFKYGERSIDLIYRAGLILSVVIATPLLVVAIVSKSIILFYIVITALVQILLAVQLSVRQFQKRGKQYFYIQFVAATSSVLLTIVLFELLPPSFENRMLAILLANLIAAMIGRIFADVPVRRYSLSRYKLAWKYIFFFGGPLILNQLSFISKGQIDKIFLYANFDAKFLGIYSLAFQIASIYTILLAAITAGTLPHFFEYLKTKNDAMFVNKLSFYSFLAALGPFFISLLIPDYLFSWFLGGSFDEVGYYISVFLLGIGLTVPYLINTQYLVYHGRNYEVSIGGIISAAIHIFFIWWVIEFDLRKSLIPFALVFSNLVMLGCVVYFTFKQQKRSSL